MKALVAGVVLSAVLLAGDPGPGRALGHGHPAASTQVVAPISDSALAALPEARYDAVIPALDAPVPKLFGRPPASIYTLTGDVALYGAARDVPVARLAARNFLGDPNVILAYQPRPDGWQLVLTPARWQLPSAPGRADAQSYAWARSETLPHAARATASIEISVSAQTLTIDGPAGSRTFPAGVGAGDTPTPIRVTGYLQARYLDPAQGQRALPIQLTTLHATAADEPYGGTDGGLIGIHLGSGSSHGCIRLGADAISAVTRLPLGTPVRIVP